MFNFFRKSLSLSKMLTKLVEQLYSTQRERLQHQAAAEHHHALALMCETRRARLESELTELARFPAEKKKLFAPETIESVLRTQLNQNRMSYMDHVSQGEHHSALSAMYAGRVERLRLQIAELQPLAKSPAPEALKAPVMKTLAPEASSHPSMGHTAAA